MRISYRIATVGGIPVVIAALIAVSAWILLERAGRSREAAVLAGTVYREMIAATAARNDFIHSAPEGRLPHEITFRRATHGAREALEALGGLADQGAQADAVDTARRASDRHTARLEELVDAIAFGDARARGMAEQEARLLALAEQARQRQHAGNATLVASLAEVDRRLLDSRAVVDGLHDLREAVLRARLAAKDAAATTDSDAAPPPEAQPRLDPLSPSLDRLERSADRLAASLARAGEGMGQDGAPAAASDAYEMAFAELTRLRAERLDRWTLPQLAPRYDAVAQRMLDITGTGHGAVQAEVAELLRRTVSAHAMEQETQTVAMTALSLSGRTMRALERRDTRGLRDVATDSGRLRDRVAGLPISPLIQDGMLAAITAWRDGLERATDGLARQNGAIAAMDMDAAAVMNTARRLNDLFQDSAVRSAGLLRSTLLIGATIGLLFAAGAALLVAGGITRPLRRLQGATRRLARDPRDGQVTDLERRDELGDMARAVHHFAAEINRREDEMRRAKEQADSTLAELRRTQAHLVQAEKLAALGQVVAGVAHEINTPLGITLTTSTLVREKVPKMKRLLDSGQLRRRELERFLTDLGDVSELLVNNTVRAAELVQRFKELAVDPAGETRRRFDLRLCLMQAVEALGPFWEPAAHRVVVDCPPGLMMDGYPQAIAQIVSHLLLNAVNHGFADGEGADGQEGERRSGTVTVVARRAAADVVELAVADDGRGIPVALRPRIFDPFFTTRRDRGHAGLGLHIVHNTVSQLGGTISLEEGEAGAGGARFVIRLPSATPEKEGA
ncbi:HAMP domain-containing protein [Azospirillum baldaniorum]|uniref:sensor histidine kinase n=1 Tax=Azospirillum baldaniorum TaxID=1064539 RepID=UPI0011AC708D|nr:HAMP domain-containing sensor histidine kinase [Azospirillum baldaniorum]TWA59382.1 HAMP domain-containing protein [Azospirillum baldaniorum]